MPSDSPRKLPLLPLSLVLLFGCTSQIFAQSVSPAGTVDVSKVEFTEKVGAPEWTAMTIEVVADAFESGGWVRDIEITLLIAYETGSRSFTFYEASAELVALEDGEEKIVAFMLPREISEMFSLREAPDYWLVDVRVAGQSQSDEGARNRFSRNLDDLSVRSSMRNQASAKVSETEGILVPIYHSPYPETFFESEPPAYRRRDR